MITWHLEGSASHKKGFSLCFLTPHMMTSKLPPPLCSSKPHKYDNYNKALCIVFSPSLPKSFSKSLSYDQPNLKDPCNQEVKVEVTTKAIKKDKFCIKYKTLEVEGIFKFNNLLMWIIFQIIIHCTKSRSTLGKLNFQFRNNALQKPLLIVKYYEFVLKISEKHTKELLLLLVTFH